MENVKLPWRRIFQLLMVTLILSGCVRGVNEKAKLSLQVPQTIQDKMGVLAAGGQLMHIVVNVKGDGMATPIIWNWDGHDSKTGATLSPPAVISIDVPAGTRRLIQYLGVYNTVDGLLQFTYGDAMKDLASGDAAVDITASTFGSSVKEGQAVGRYLTVANQGPTATLIGAFQPPASASSTGVVPPPMDLMLAGMFNGWFKIMVFDGAPMTWRDSFSGSVVFSNIDLNSTMFATSSGSIMRVHVPAHKRAWADGNGTIYMSQVETQGEEQIIYGFFGPGVAASTLKNVCYMSGAGGGLMGMYSRLMADTTADGIADSNTQLLTWDGSLTATSCSAATNISTVCRLSGGLTNGNCTGTAGIDYVDFDHNSIGQGSDGRLGFNGPFKVIASQGGGDFVYSNYQSTGQVTIGWQYISAGVASALTGVSVYYNSSGQELHGGGDDVLCDQAVKGNGYMLLADVPSTQNSYIWQSPVSLNPALTRFALCPYRQQANSSRQYFPGTVGSHGFQGQYPATRLALNVMGKFSQGTQGSCYPVYVLGLDNFNNIGSYTTAPANFSLQATGSGAGAFYENESCTTTLSAWSPAAAEMGSKLIYFKSNGVDSLSVSADGFISAPAVTLDSSSTNYAIPSAGAGLTLFNAEIASNTCQEMFLLGVNTAGGLARFSNPGTAFLSDSGGGGSFYSDGQCTTVQNSLALSTSQSTYKIYYRNNAPAGTSVTLQVADTTASPTTIYYSKVITLIGGGAPARSFTTVQPYSAPSIYNGLCYPMQVQLVDSYNRATKATKNMAYSVNVMNGAMLYATPDCSDAGSSTRAAFVLSGQMSDSSIYVIPIGPSSADFQVQFPDFGSYPESFYIMPQMSMLQITGSVSASTVDNLITLGLFNSDGVTPIPTTEIKNMIQVSVSLMTGTNAGLHLVSGGSNIGQAALSLVFTPGQNAMPFYVETDAGSNTDYVSATATGTAGSGISPGTNLMITW